MNTVDECTSIWLRAAGARLGAWIAAVLGLKSRVAVISRPAMAPSFFFLPILL